MLSELTIDMKAAAASAPFPASPTASVVWCYSLKEILAKVLEKAVELGRDYRPQIEQAARDAVDALVTLDLPGIPPVIENAVDSATRQLGYTAIAAVCDAILGPAS
jgi:hypothetical protein